MSLFQNEMILASAGSGKTYRLTSRFVRLLAHDPRPERIIALTFTRKAAGEFLDEILRKLSGAASDPARAAALGVELDLAGFDSARATALLRILIDQLHLLTLGTLDSFFNRILRCFPAEFGLGSGFEMLEDFRAAEIRRQVLADLFADTTVHQDFLEAFKLATFGTEEKSLSRLLDTFIKEHHETFLRAPHERQWGMERTIWPQGCRWLRGLPDPEQECKALESALSEVDFIPKALKMWGDFLEVIRNSHPGRKRPSKSATLLARLLELYPALLESAPVEIKIDRRTYTLTPNLQRHVARVLDYFLFCEFLPHVRRTQGIYQLLTAYEERYHRQIRRAGLLGFNDVQMLLAGTLEKNLPRELGLGASEDRLNIDYRLDGQFDHWLLDEFQDTSLLQWKVIANLIDEVIQDTERGRSLFYVGDVKQAIFGWRGGDSRLFEDIFHHYNRGGQARIVEHTMEESRRSGPALMDAVNRIFGNAGLLRALFPEHRPFVDRWNAVWRDHRAHDETRRDYFECLILPKKDDVHDDAGLAERRMALTADRIHQLDLVRRQLSCAVLVRKNATAHAIADYLRSHTTVPVVVEGDTMSGSDHPVASSFLALLQFTAHPGDSLAWEHLCMTPALQTASWKQLISKRRELVAECLESLHEDGFGGVFERWLEQLFAGGFVPDPFSRRRIDQLRQACSRFDDGGSRSIPEFLRFARACTTRENPAPGSVQVMTIHKSKGLGFDAVIIAEVEGGSDAPLTDTGNLSLVARESGEGLDREIDWILSMPRKDVAEIDPQLREARFQLECRAAYENLCSLYVALTRAKYGTYLICSEAGKNPSARSLVLQGLEAPSLPTAPPFENRSGYQAAIAFQSGDPAWFEADRFTSVPIPPDTAAPPPITAVRPFAALPRAIPSSAEPATTTASSSAAAIFSRRSIDAADFGTRVHELFELIGWLGEDAAHEVGRILAAVVHPLEEQHETARNEVLASLACPEIARLFHSASFSPDPEPTLWREKRFELVHQGSWISGVFDRVVISGDRAWIFDFKTNRLATESEILRACQYYEPQLKVYRSALARILRLPESAIAASLIFTHPGQVREVIPPA